MQLLREAGRPLGERTGDDGIDARPTREPNGTLRFGAELDEGDQVWFQIEEEAIRRMPDRNPEARGRRLLDALRVWLAADRSLRSEINRFEVQVTENGDTWIERLRW